jgi:hypothetical protein
LRPSYGFKKCSLSQTPDALISINIRLTSLKGRDVDYAHEKVTNHLLDYMYFIGDSGAKGRLIYEVSTSSTDRHATNCVVEWRGPNGPGFLALVELPFVLHNGRRSYHAHMMIKTQENSYRVKCLGFFIKVYGDDFGVPLKYCDPCALTGDSSQDVDEAVEAVRRAINMHMSTCACTF